MRRAAEPAGPLAKLSDQERTVLELIGEGLTNRQIGERMFLAEKTVKNYVSHLLAKLGMERRTQAAVLATELRGERAAGAPAERRRSAEGREPAQPGAAVGQRARPSASPPRRRARSSTFRSPLRAARSSMPHPVVDDLHARRRPPRRGSP